jgi:hypothetical protein
LTRFESKGQSKEIKAKQAAKQDSSFIFSLAELSRMELERVAAEKRTAELQREAILRAQEEADARRAQEAARQAREAAAAAEEAGRRDRAELARLEAEQRALVEAARVRVEIEARAKDGEKQRAQELEIERARAAAKIAGTRRTMVGVVIGALFAGCVALSLQLGVVQPRTNAALGQATAQLADSDNQLRDAKTAAADKDKQLADANGRLDAQKAENAKLKQQLADAQHAGGSRAPAWYGTGNGQVTQTHVVDHSHDNETVCAPGNPTGDPMCAGH